ncbi:hypothetical protein [Polymorphospora sp. NPDC050346]|uniref:hypothetical protein n=1 Tax=Polymorphospora sp. NPDC050346 TaxID=3155780 RepID=UPI0033E17D17
MALTRKSDPLIDIGRGLFQTALWAAAGTTITATALSVSDSFSTWVLNSSTDGQFGERMTLALTTQIGSPGLVIVLGILAMIAAIFQAVMMLFREGAIVILTGVVVFAAAGQFNPVTRPWLRRILAWMAALVFYKPAAALVYATGFIMIGDGSGPRTMFMGFTVLGLSIIALPAMLKFFNWAVGAAGDGGGALPAALAAAGGGLHAASWSRSGSGGDGAADHARYLQQTLGPQPSPAPPGGAAPAGAGTAGRPGPVGSGPMGKAGDTAAPAARATSGAVPASSGASTMGGASAGGAAAGGAAAAGPIGIGVAAAAQGVQAAASGAKSAANTASNATDGG